MAKKRQPAKNRQQQQAAAQARRQRASGGGGGGVRAGSGRPAAKPVTDPEQARDAAPGPQRFYLDVATVRIQDWLGRTPNLKFRRGASALLTDATAKATWCQRLPERTAWNPEAGDIAGVVSLVAVDGLDAEHSKAALCAAGREVAAYIRGRVPHCPLQAVMGWGESYAHAYQVMSRHRRAGELVVDAPAPPGEMLLAKPCDVCRQSAAEHTGVVVVDSPRELCNECMARLDAAGGTKGDNPRWSPEPERAMLAAVEAALAGTGHRIDGFSHDFLRMAVAGGSEPDDAATQLALIYADGNKLGAFLDRAAAKAKETGTPEKGEIVLAVDRATRTALGAAVARTFALAPDVDTGIRVRPPALAHIAGGDDLMVSVPASYAWAFVRHLLRRFGAEMATSTSRWQLAVAPPSMSAGVVFHHHTHPFSDVVAKATDHQKQAKRATAGDQATVSFLDLTADGDQAPRGRVHTLADLDRDAGLLGRVAVVPVSQRHSLVALHRQSLEPGPCAAAAENRRGETPEQALARRVAELGHRSLWEIVAGPDAEADTVRERLEADPEARACLRRKLDLARWWPRTDGDERDDASPEEER